MGSGMISEGIKKEIDDMDYESMLRLWRYVPAGHAMFKGETGDYYAQAMKDKRAQIGNEAHVAISKKIGFR